MKEKDFDEIGKRLYDMEAEPPSDGWKKIAPVVVPTAPSRIVLLRRHWWKPLVVILPVVFYSIYYSNNNTGVQPILHTEIENLPEAPASETDVPAGETENETSREPMHHKTETAPKNDNESSVGKNSGTRDHGTSIENNVKGVASEFAMKSTPMNVDKPLGNGNGNKEESERMTTDMEGVTTLSEKQPANARTSSGSPMVLKNQLTDSVELVDEEQLAMVVADSTPTADEETKKRTGNWRITASFTPSYFRNTVSPVTSDDVYITSVSASDKFQNGNYGVALGIGMSIGSNLNVDGQLIYNRTNRDVSFSYTTGNVDTLLAMELPDKSVQVKPVYEIANRDISSTLNYGGLQLGLTYYFLKTQKSRFNVLANGGIHYMFASEILELKNGNWVEISSENINKVNFSVTLGAGYNLKIHPGWEIMISPCVTWFLKEMKLENAPYTQNQQLVGVNFMIARTLGDRRK